MATIDFTAPAHWHDYLISKDRSVMSDHDVEACDRWLGIEFGSIPFACIGSEPTEYDKFPSSYLAGVPSSYADDLKKYTFSFEGRA